MISEMWYSRTTQKFGRLHCKVVFEPKNILIMLSRQAIIPDRSRGVVDSLRKSLWQLMLSERTVFSIAEAVPLREGEGVALFGPCYDL